MTAIDDLAHIEDSTNWAALIEQALADPPNPKELAHWFSHWAHVFESVYGGWPMPPDYPPGMERFLKMLAFSGIPPELCEWADSFEQVHKRRPRLEELPISLRRLMPKPGKKRGRPRCDTQRLQNAARAWAAEILRSSYEIRREGIEFGRDAGFVSCFGFDQPSMHGDRPSALAIEKLADETDKKGNYLLDILFPRKRK